MHKFDDGKTDIRDTSLARRPAAQRFSYHILLTSRQQTYPSKGNLLVILLGILADNVVEPKLVNTLGGGDNPQPVAELLLLEELLGQVLEVATAELLVGDDLDLAVLLVGDGDVVAEVSGQALDLDALLEESGKGAWVEDLVVGWLSGVDGELV